MKKILFILLSLIATSCVSMHNSDMAQVKIVTKSPAKIVFKNDTILTDAKNEAILNIPRSRDSVEFRIFNDNLTKKIRIPSKSSFLYWLNLYFSTPWPFTQIDFSDPKHYDYPTPLYIDWEDKTKGYTLDNEYNRKQGDWNVLLSFPYVNDFLIKPSGEGCKSSIGFLGLAFGTEFYYMDNRFINLTISGGLNHVVPFPVGVDRFGGHYEDFCYANLGISNNYRFKRLGVGFGLSYTKNRWQLMNLDMPTIPRNEYKLKTYDAFGLIFPLSYQIGRKFYVGLTYRPTFLQLSPNPTIKYEHTISLDFGWRFPLKQNSGY